MSQGAAYIRARLPQEKNAVKNLEAIPAHIGKQPLHPGLAALRQGKSQQRNFSTAARRILSSVAGPAQRAGRASSGPTIRSALSKTTLAPFSSPLRPNLTGGALPRSAGGYTLGGNGVRHFSSTPAAQAQVVQNVSAAIRAFCVNGFRADYDGVDVRTGEKRYRAVTTAQEKALAGLRFAKQNARGTTLKFHIAPTITSVPSTDIFSEATLNSENLLAGLASDFSRSLASLSLVHSDLTRLSTLGSLPISHPNPHTIEVRFAGCDAKTVQHLCDELGVQRGIIREDPEWNENDGDKDVGMALLFPWAPSHPGSDISAGNYYHYVKPTDNLDWQSMLSPSSSLPLPATGEPSEDGYAMVAPSAGETEQNPWLDSTQSEGFDRLHESDIESNDDFGLGLRAATGMEASRPLQPPTGYEGMEGILRFLEECDTARR